MRKDLRRPDQWSEGKAALVHRLLAYLRSWHVSHIVADATGVGEGLCDWLASAFGQDRVTQVKFSRLTKAQLGAGFLAVVETGRFQYWLGEDAETPLSDGWWFWQQCGHCIYEIKPGGTWERDPQWAVPASARVDTPAGLSRSTTTGSSPRRWSASTTSWCWRGCYAPGGARRR